MASLKIANSVAELSAALNELIEPVSDAAIVLQMIGALRFRSRSAERELASAISNSAVTFRALAHEHRELCDHILAGARALYEQARALAEQEDESNDQG